MHLHRFALCFRHSYRQHSFSCYSNCMTYFHIKTTFLQPHFPQMSVTKHQINQINGSHGYFYPVFCFLLLQTIFPPKKLSKQRLTYSNSLLLHPLQREIMIFHHKKRTYTLITTYWSFWTNTISSDDAQRRCSCPELCSKVLLSIWRMCLWKPQISGRSATATLELIPTKLHSRTALINTTGCFKQ